MSRVHTQQHVKPDEHTVSARVSNDLPGVLPPVVSNRASSSKEHKQPKLAGYQVHEHIGGGAFGNVYRAEWTRIQPSLRQPLAIKLLPNTGKVVLKKGERRHAEENCYLDIY